MDKDAEQYDQRMRQLFQFYRVPYGEWRMLCGHLAARHVPAFQLASYTAGKTGRRTFWTEDRKLKLLAAMESHTRQGETVSSAAQRVKATTRAFAHFSVGTIRRQYSAAKRARALGGNSNSG